MNSQNPRSDTVLDGYATLSAGAVTEEGRGAQGGSSGRGSAPPPPPPPPTASNIDQRKIAEERYRQALKERRQLRRQTHVNRLRQVNRTHWYAIGGVCAIALVGWQARSLMSMQRDTAQFLSTQNARIAAQQAPQPVAVAPQQEFPNPLESFALTDQARWMIGLSQDETLIPKRSSVVVAELISQADVCGMYIGLGSGAALELSADPKPGFVPFATADLNGKSCTTGAPMPVPSDPVPTPTTVAQ